MHTSIPPKPPQFFACSTASWRTPGPVTMGSWCSGLGTTELLRALRRSPFPWTLPPPFQSMQRKGATRQQKAQDWGSVGTWNLKSTERAKIFCFSSIWISGYLYIYIYFFFYNSETQQMHACKIVRFSLVTSLVPTNPFCYLNPATQLCLLQLSLLNCWILLDL